MSCRTRVAASEAAPRARNPRPQPAISLAKAAIQQAEKEGLTLLACPKNASGFHSVLKDTMTAGLVKPFRVQVRRCGVRVTLGRFGTAEEAALCYARSPEGRALRAQMPVAIESDVSTSSSAAQVRQTARQEGLPLLPAQNLSGFKNVAYDGASYRPWVYRHGTQKWLGRFPSPEAAALVYARTPEGRADAAIDRAGAPANRQPPDDPCIKKKQRTKPAVKSKALVPDQCRRLPEDASQSGISADSTTGGASAAKKLANVAYPTVRLIGPRPVSSPGPCGPRGLARASAAKAASPDGAAVEDWTTVDEMLWWLVDALSPSKIDQSA